MKKRIVTIALVVALLATCIAGTYAYLTDTDAAKNVMTVGNVSIIQEETNEKGGEFQDGQKLFPYTGSGDMMDKANEEAVDTEYYEGFVPKTANNWITKLVTVKNDGSEDAYVRTLFAFQILENGHVAADPATGLLAWRTTHGLYFDLHQYTASVYFPKVNDEYVTYVDADGVKYIVGEYLYKMDIGEGKYDSMLKAGERSHPSLKSIALESTVDNDVAKLFKDYKILVVSQAVQTKGFTDANGNGVICDDALNTAFGALAEADQAKLAKWFANAK